MGLYFSFVVHKALTWFIFFFFDNAYCAEEFDNAYCAEYFSPWSPEAVLLQQVPMIVHSSLLQYFSAISLRPQKL